MDLVSFNRFVLEAMNALHRDVEAEFPTLEYQVKQFLVKPEVFNKAQLQVLTALYRRLVSKRRLSHQRASLEHKKSCFAIVTPVRNSVLFIDQAIESVVNQLGQHDVYYHVQDGGSNDGTIERLKYWQDEIHENNLNLRFSWDSCRDGGMYDAINRGFDAISCRCPNIPSDEIISTWINADDLLATNALQTVSTFFNAHPQFDWVTGISSIIEENGASVALFDVPKAFSRDLLRLGFYDGTKGPYVQQEGTFWRLSLWQLVNGADPGLQFAGDWDLWRRFAEFSPLVKVDSVLGYHRRHAGQLTADHKRYSEEIASVETKASHVMNPDITGVRAYFDLSKSSWNVVNMPAAVKDNVDEFKTHIHNASTMAVSSELKDLATVQPNGKPWPRISVVTPSFNQGKYIEETIRSVIAQGYPWVEHIIVDGGSSDETTEVINRYRSHLAHVISEPDDGQSDAINKGFSLATGEIFCWLNSDDQFAPNALWNVAMAFVASDADMVAGICEIYEDGELQNRHLTSCSNGPLPLHDLLDLERGWNGGQFFYQPEVFFTRKLWERAGSHVRTDCYYSMDYELWCRFAIQDATLRVISAPIARFRTHADQKTADPRKFKEELKTVRAEFIRRHGIDVKESNRPPVNWNRSLTVALVNDNGFKYGAGIAQQRIAASFDLAGHEVEVIELKKDWVEDGKVKIADLRNTVSSIRPDLIIFGNIHSAVRESAAVVEALCDIAPSFWITHDFWIFTGRCAYMSGCEKFLHGCDSSCPTPNEYPQLEPSKIALAWKNKRDLMLRKDAPMILANSTWAKETAQLALDAISNDKKPRIAQIQLGAPIEQFESKERLGARREFNIPEGEFVIAYNVSSLKDPRKGARFLVDALNQINLPNISIILIGEPDDDFSVQTAKTIPLGYVTDPSLLSAAMAAADVYVGPSTEETFGQVYIEAALCGTPSIGFDNSGVRDAIIEGVTGTKVPMTVSALRAAIVQSYMNRARTASMGALAKRYAESNFTLESMYRSFFRVFDELGLIDRWGLAHKVSFQKKVSKFIPLAKCWRPRVGISPLEGPYENLDITEAFHWCHGEEIQLAVKTPKPGDHEIVLNCANPLFDSLKIQVSFNADELESIELNKGTVLQRVRIPIRSVSREWGTLRLRPNKIKASSETEKRQLSFMLANVSVESNV